MRELFQTVRIFIWMTALSGLLYPLLITGISHILWDKNASGDFIQSEGKIIGAPLIAQKFESDRYFWPRPSANDYNPLASGGSNLSATSQKLKIAVSERRERILKSQSSEKEAIPSELLFASASGLDPHISASAAYFQISRIAKARGIDEKTIRKLVNEKMIKPPIPFIGTRYVNVLLLNLALDALTNANK